MDNEQFIASAAFNLPIVHHQQLELLHIVDNKFLETIRKIMTSFLVCTVANVRHKCASLELSSYTRINTLWPTPVCLSKKHSNKVINTK